MVVVVSTFKTHQPCVIVCMDALMPRRHDCRMQDDSREGGGREGLEHILEVERLRTNIGHIRVDSMDGIGRVESGTETEKMSGTYFPDKVEEVYKRSIH